MDRSNQSLGQASSDDAFQAGLQAALAEASSISSHNIQGTIKPSAKVTIDRNTPALPIRQANNHTEPSPGLAPASSDVLGEVSGNGSANVQTQGSDPQGDATDQGGEENWGGDERDDSVEVGVGAEDAPKKKKKRKSNKKKGMSQPSGFEEYYVDAPVTPEEFEEEQDLYSAERPFSVRIQTAIQRYTSRRKFDSARKDLFDKYMDFGGIDSGPKMFAGGLDNETLEESTAAEIAGMTATNYVGEDKVDHRARDFVVDFDGVLKGFLSSRLPQYFDLTLQSQIKTYISVIRNFLNYLLHHNVCLEYNSQINAARTTCNLAEDQLWKITQAARLMPGDFNIACSTFFGGYYQDTRVGDAEWARGIDTDRGMGKERAERIFKTGLAAYGEQRVLDKYTQHVKKSKARVVEVIRSGFEVTEIIPANEEVLKMYADPVCTGLLPLGKLGIKVWHNPFLAPMDLTEEEEIEEEAKKKVYKGYELWVEDTVLEKCFVGMKFDATIRLLSFGVYYLDHWEWGYCSFYDVLPNELMLGFREHVYLPPRPKQGDEDGQADGENEEIGDGDPDKDAEAELEKYEKGEDIVVGV